MPRRSTRDLSDEELEEIVWRSIRTAEAAQKELRRRRKQRNHGNIDTESATPAHAGTPVS